MAATDESSEEPGLIGASEVVVVETNGAPEVPEVAEAVESRNGTGASYGPYGKLSPGPGRPASEVAAHQRERIQRAMVESVGENGYSNLKVRELVRLAGVSTRAFYEHFDSKEDCFLQTHKLVVRRAARRLIAAQAEERRWEELPRLVLGTFARELESEIHSARLALVEAYSAGPAALEQARRVERTFEAMLSESLSRDPKGIPVPPMVVEGIVAGVACVARARLCAGREAELAGVEGELLEWALCYLNKYASALTELDGRSPLARVNLDPQHDPSTANGGEPRETVGDRAAILSAVDKLAAANGYDNLTAPRIRRAAGVSRKTFDAHFDGVEDCYLEALKYRAGDLFTDTAGEQSKGRTWTGGLYRAVFTLCHRVAGDPILTNLCDHDDFPPNSTGSLYRKHLAELIANQLPDPIPPHQLPTDLVREAVTGAIWSVFHHHVIREPALQGPRIAATLTYLATAPAIGASSVVAAIRKEQAQ